MDKWYTRMNTLRVFEDTYGVDIGLSCLPVDTNLRLSSHNDISVTLKLDGVDNRIEESTVETLERKNDLSLTFDLGNSGREVGGSMSSVYLDLNLSEGDRAGKDIHTFGTTTISPKTGRLEVDLELSLSTAVVESDLTSVTMLSSSVTHFDDVDTPRSNQQRKTNVKPCKFPGCQKGARGASGRCISHGGGRRCQRVGCQKGAESKTAFCKAHGGGRRCEYLGCTKSAEGRTNFCIAHGGGRRCANSGCTHAARGKTGLCIRHGGGKRCKMENCTKSAEGQAGLCIAHGGGRRCQYSQCTKGAQGSTKFCKAHGGGKRCTFIGCTKGAEGSTLFCKAHGGGKRCSFQGDGFCSKSVHGGTLYCVSHGGGKRCGVSGCTKSARGRTQFCVRHGGGKRCMFEGCGKSAQGSTDFCRAHGEGKLCLWGQPGSAFGGDSVNLCDRFARGRTGMCTAHVAQVQDKRVHGDGSVGLEMKGIDVNFENLAKSTGEGSSTSLTEFSIGNYGYYQPLIQMNLPDNKNLLGMADYLSNPISLPEGRVHGGSLMAMLKGGGSNTPLV